MKKTDSPIDTINYSRLDTELLSEIWLASTSTGLFYLGFEEDLSHFLIHILELTADTAKSPSMISDPKSLNPYKKALTEYFIKRQPIPQSLELDLRHQTPFQQKILLIVQNISFGQTVTYGDIADQINNPGSTRAIGQVLRRNPIPVIIPCHRVVNADGTLGGYGGIMGSDRKLALLKHEGVIFT